MSLKAFAGAVVLTAMIGSAAFSRPPKKKTSRPPAPPIQAQSRGTLQVEARMNCRGKDMAARLLTVDGVQSNFSEKDPAKNLAFTFNFQPNVADNGNDEVELQYLFDCTELDKPSSSSQIQGVARVPSGTETLIADSDVLQLRVKVSILKNTH